MIGCPKHITGADTLLQNAEYTVEVTLPNVKRCSNRNNIHEQINEVLRKRSVSSDERKFCRSWWDQHGKILDEYASAVHRMESAFDKTWVLQSIHMKQNP